MRNLVPVLAGALSLAIVVPAFAIPRESDVPPLIKKLSDKNPKVRAEAAKELGHIGTVKGAWVKDAVEPLLKMAKDEKDLNARLEALSAIGQLRADPDKVVPILVDALKSDDEKLKVGAARGLQNMGEAGSAAMPELKKIQDEIRKLNKDEQKKKRNLAQAVNMAMMAIRGGN